MSKLMFLYVQTSGQQQNYNTPVTDYDNWTRIVSISWNVNNEYSDYHSWSKHRIIRPIGFTFNVDTENFIQISFEKAVNEGHSHIEVLQEIKKVCEQIDFFVGHNIQFHLNVLRSEFIRFGLGDIENYNSTICLMRKGVELCKLSSSNGYKYPSLEELNLYLFGDKIKYLLYGNKHIANMYALEGCYKKMFNYNCFIEYGFKSDPAIHLLKVPFKEDGFPNNTFIEITENTNNKKNAYVNYGCIYENFDNFRKSDKWGLYVFEKHIENWTEYLLTDYRGVEILQTINRKIDFGFDPVDDIPEVFVNGKPFCDVVFYKQGLFLHNYSNVEFVDLEESENNFFSLSNRHLNKVTVILQLTGKVLFRDEKVVYHKKSDKFIRCFKDSFEILNFNGFKLKTVKFDGNIEGFTENGMNLFFKNKGKIGVVDLQGRILITNEYEYLNLIEDSKYYYEFRVDESNGILKDDNKIIFYPGYNFDVAYEDSLFHIINTSDNNLKHGLINLEGEVVVEVENESLIKDEDDEKFKYYKIKKREGENGILILNNFTLIKPLYNEVDFRDRYIFVSKNGLEGIYDYSGNIILECKYVFGRDLSWTELNSVVIKTDDGNKLYSIKDNQYILNDFDDLVTIRGVEKERVNLAVIKNGLIMFKDYLSEWQSGYYYESWFEHPLLKKSRTPNFRWNRLIVIKNGLFGYVDENFNEVISCKYEFAYTFEHFQGSGYSKVQLNGKTFYIDVNDKRIDFDLDLDFD